MMMRTEDIVIIGAGPAGISTAIQLRRYGFHPVIIEKNKIGGLLRSANLVENYPGFPEGISGRSLVSLFEQQLRSVLAEIIFEEAIELDSTNDVLTIKTANRVIYARVVVIASGTRPAEWSGLNIPTELDSAILDDITPILDVTDEQVVIVGAGDTAFDYALNLSKRNQVTILNRGRQISCIPLLLQRARKSERITYLENTALSSIQTINTAEIHLVCRCNGKTTILDADYLLLAIGREPQLDFLSEHCRVNLGALEQDRRLYLVGDVRNGSLRQTAIAVGDGVAAAMKINDTFKSAVCTMTWPQ